MNIYRKATIVGLMLLTTAACKEVQLNGPVANASIFIDLLSQPGLNTQSTTTSVSGDTISEVGLAEWIEMPNAIKFLHVGNFEVKDNKLDLNSLYLVRASSGDDVDADRDGIYDVASTDVNGHWRAIMSGEELMANGNIVSALTEAAYQYVYKEIGLGTDEDLRQKLNEFAQLVVSDVDKDGDVDYTDVLKWTRLYSEDQYLGDINFLYDLIAVIMADEPDHIRYAAAASVWSNSPIDPIDPEDVEPTVISGSAGSGDVYWTRNESPYVINTNLNINGDLYIEGGVEIDGGDNVILLFGDLIIDGLPRNPAWIGDLRIVLSNFPASAESRIKFAHFDEGEMTSKTRRFIMENSSARRWILNVHGVINSNDHYAEIKQNVFSNSEFLVENRAAAYFQYEVNFINNLFVPPDSTDAVLTTEWEGPKGNFAVENNSFQPNMRILRGEGDPVLSVQNNYWGKDDKDDLDFDEIIPNNPVVGGDFEHIFLNPILKDPHPDTPVLP